MKTDDTDRKGGTYSRKKLLYIGVAWFLLGMTIFAFAPSFSANADVRGCDSAPCMFPAQSNIGGIVLGTDNISGSGLIAFGVGNTANINDLTSPERVWAEEPAIRLGLNNLNANNFFIYKGFGYFDQRVGDGGETVPVYIWADANTAYMNSSTDICGDDTDGLGGAESCDLLAGTSEVSTSELVGQASCSGTFINFCGFVPNTLSDQDFWTAEPEKDTCGAAGALSGTICLGLIGDSPATVLGVSATVDNVEAYDFMIRSHVLRGVPGQDDGGADKTMFLENAYFEIRYGTGYDRINHPTSQEGGVDYAQPVSGPYGVAALANDFPCEGGGPSTFCTPPSDTIGNIEGMEYDNIHAAPVDDVDN